MTDERKTFDAWWTGAYGPVSIRAEWPQTHTDAAWMAWQARGEEIARLTALLTPKPLDENAPKDRELIGVERPPYEDRTYYRMIKWREDEQSWMTKSGVDWATRQCIWAFCGVTHYLDPQELPGLPYSDGSDIEADEWDEEGQP